MRGNLNPRIFTRAQAECDRKRFLSYVDIRGPEECWPWLGGLKNGDYGLFSPSWDWRTRVPAHRFSYTLHKGEIPAPLWVLHSCDNRVCVNPGHLFLGTAKDNAQDCARKGRVWRTRLNPDQARAIRAAKSRGATYSELEHDLSVRQGTIHAVLTRRTWAHVD